MFQAIQRPGHDHLHDLLHRLLDVLPRKPIHHLESIACAVCVMVGVRD
jgi:hypothetical protein